MTSNTDTADIPVPPAISKWQKKNFETLQRAMKAGDVALISAVRRDDHSNETIICVMNRGEDGGFNMIPVAVMRDPDKILDEYFDPTTG